MPSLSNNSTWVNALLSFAAIGVIVLCGIGVHTARQAADNSDEILRHSQIQSRVRSVLSAIKEAENSQRGYLITGDDKYLAPFHAGVSEIGEHLASLKQHSETGHLMPERLAQLENLISGRQAEIEETIEARRDGSDEEAFLKARNIVVTDRGISLMKEIETTVRDILAIHDEELNELHQLSSQLAGRHELMLATGLILTLGTFLAAAVVTNREREERNRAVIKLRRERARHVAVIDASMDAVVAVDHAGHTVMLNPVGERLFQRSGSDVQGQPFEQFVAPPYRSKFAALMNPSVSISTARNPVNNGQIILAVKADGSQFPAEAVVSRSVIDGELLFTVMLRDVTERETGRARLREQTAILARIRDSIHIRDLNDKILTWNEGAQNLFGWEASETVGRQAASLFSNSLQQAESQILEELLKNGVWVGEREITTKSGRVRLLESRRSLIVDSEGNPASQLVIDIDITDQRQRERIERRSQRLESIGTLTSGIAHDLNNILTPITMGARLLRNYSGNEQGAGLIDTIVSSADRGASMIRQLLSFAGGTSGARESVDVNSLIAEACGILRHTLTPGISVRTIVAESLWPIMADTTELSQVLMNLAINARDAMPKGGVLTFETANATLTKRSSHTQLPPGRYVRVAVTDTGTGIPFNILERIFDPFFTTKDQGKGTGLGLATCMGIVKSHDGNFSVYSEPGRGTNFTFYIPACQVETGHAAQSHDKLLPVGMGRQILLVDDEESILQMAAATLELHGFRVISALGGAAAIKIFEQHHADIDVAIVDLMMPEIDGTETIRVLKSIRSDLRIISSSGLRRPDQGKGGMIATDGFLSKPYTDEELLLAISAALKNSSSSNRENNLVSRH